MSSIQKFYTMNPLNQQQSQPQMQQHQQLHNINMNAYQQPKDNHFDDPNCYFYTSTINTKHKLYDNLLKPTDHHHIGNENHMSSSSSSSLAATSSSSSYHAQLQLKNDTNSMIPLTLDCADLSQLHMQNSTLYTTHQIQPQQVQSKQQQQFYSDSNLLQNLDLTSTQSFGDYVIKYDTPTNSHHTSNGTVTTSNENDIDEEDEDEDEEDDEMDDENSFMYDTSDAGSNLELKNTNASLLDGYSVFDSPLSLYTSNDDFNNALLNSLNNTSTRDFGTNGNNCNNNNNNAGMYATLNTTQSHTQLKQQTSTTSSSSASGNDLSTNTSSTTSSQVAQQMRDDNKNSKSDSKQHMPILNDYELISLPLRELNKRLRFVPKSAAIDLKKRRRTLKNRKYAQNCRSKRLEQKSEMEIQNIKLKGDLSRLQKILEKTTKEKYLYKAYITELVKDPSKINSLQLEWNDINKE